MQVIKKIFLIIYIVFLGFIVFCNTSVFADEVGEIVPTKVSQTSSSFDDYFTNMQDEFDYYIITQSGNGYRQAYDFITRYNNFYNYYAEKVSDTGYGSGDAKRGYLIYLFNFNSGPNILSLNEGFGYVNFQNYNNDMQNPTRFNYPIVTNQSYFKVAIYNYGTSFVVIDNGVYHDFNLPFVLSGYSHPVLHDYLLDTTSGGQVATAIQQQTNTIKEESQKQQNAVATATQKQTNDLLDTNNTGNETMSVNDTTTDTSADLSSIYNNISSAFTTYDPTISWGKDFVFTLPNGDNFTINLDSSLILNFLDDYPVLKAFYQSIFWVIFGGYVIFDFKKIINKMKEGNIDNVVGTSSPVDSVVNLSLK